MNSGREKLGLCLECGYNISIGDGVVGGYPRDGDEDKRICGVCAGVSMSMDYVKEQIMKAEEDLERWCRVRARIQVRQARREES